jgi:predicted RNA polymerase sigma factor
MAYGPQSGLDVGGHARRGAGLRNYHLLPSVRGDLLKKLGRLGEARQEFERAAALTRNARERTLLLARATACAG